MTGETHLWERTGEAQDLACRSERGNKSQEANLFLVTTLLAEQAQ